MRRTALAAFAACVLLLVAVSSLLLGWHRWVEYPALLGKVGVMEDRSDRPSFVLDGGSDLPLRGRIDAHRLAFGVDVGVLVWHPICEL